ncbi:MULTISPECIES: asparagine synthase-related protein [unclassified Ectothiorhodospira]|uniref:asparagine synthase-related protein n=1 Tax=unclassified Ectothiorhodospira TaxID=2684909 RepID=UPI001EE89417|nr:MULTISPECIES: asparagine synthase-related protein [unclassified Ectothiorhodospira]MCG5516371.1 hypothetical protein [Ectothiorhodospira sp. 9100]MCG5519379.1 hypothetical protein [Ectothiorhodospira sp. 9905]
MTKLDDDVDELRKDLRKRALPFGWFERLGSGSVRFTTDHSGSVPLYYAQVENKVLAGNTPLEVVRQMKGSTFDPVSVADFILNGTVCYPYTLFKDVYVVPPGAVTVIKADSICSKRFYLPEELRDSASVQQWGARLHEEVERALLIGLKGKREIKVLFSGGEDSRAVVSLIPRSIDCELITFADNYNREVRLAERAAKALKRPFRFIQRPEGFYRKDIRGRTLSIGGSFDVAHTHVYGELASNLGNADAIVGGFTSDSLFKSLLVQGIRKSVKRLGPERIESKFVPTPVGIANPLNHSWLAEDVAKEVNERRWAHHKKIEEFRPYSASNWHWLWPLGCHQGHYAHYLAIKNLRCSVVEPFLAPQVYSLAALMPDEFRADRKAFREAFARSMGLAGWLPTSSGRIPRLGGYTGHWLEFTTVSSRMARDRLSNFLASILGRPKTAQGAWNSDHGSFRYDFCQQITALQVEQLRQLLGKVLAPVEASTFLEPGGGRAPDWVRHRLLQVAYLMDE